MAPSPPKAGQFGEGVYFASGDYASLSARVFIVIIDLLVIWLMGILLAALLQGLGYTAESTFTFSWLLVSYLYLTVFKASPVRTAGFAVTGVKIITLNGARPSVLRMTLRLLLWFFGPFMLPWDLLWLSGDDCRQSLRDKIAGTYVVKKNATPLGHGPIQLKYLFCFGMTLACLEVKKLKAAVSAG